MRHSDGRIQNSEIIVDLRGGRDGRAWIGRGDPLLDGNGGRESLDMIDIGLLHLIEKLPRIRRKTLDITALPLGKKRVKGQRGLPRTTWPGDHHHLIAGDIQREIAEIMLPRPLDPDDSCVSHYLIG